MVGGHAGLSDVDVEEIFLIQAEYVVAPYLASSPLLP